MAIRYQQHKANWLECQECPLWETRGKVVLAKGKLPCDLLFIGEAPGISENLIGKPFIGPAGKLLDEMIQSAGLQEAGVRLAYTNIISCIPWEDQELSTKVKQPPKESVKACTPRLHEFLTMARPKLLVALGKFPEKVLSKDKLIDTPIEALTHPAAIARLPYDRKGLAIQRMVINLASLGRRVLDES